MVITKWQDELSYDEITLLSLVQHFGQVKRPTLLDHSPYGISKTDSIVKKLTKNSFIRIVENETAGKGRNPHLYSVNPELAYFVGLELSPEYDQLVLTDFAGKRVAEKRMPASYQSGSISSNVITHIKSLLTEQSVEIEDLHGIGIAPHGVIDRVRGTLHLLPQVGRASDQEFRRPIENAFGIPTFVAQPKFFTLVSRCRRGETRGAQTVANVNLGHGVGMGIAVNGSYFLGDTGVAGQIGHIRIPGWEKTCYCGNVGCLATRASYAGMRDDALERINKGFVTSLDPSILEDRDAETGANHIIDKAIENDKMAATIIYDICYALGEVLSHVVTILNPALLLINSNLVRAGDLFTGPVRLWLKTNTITESVSRLEIRFLPLDSSDVAEGAAFYSLQRFLDRQPDCLLLPQGETLKLPEQMVPQARA